MMNSSFLDASSMSFHPPPQPVRRGSLPLKKRRFTLETGSSDDPPPVCSSSVAVPAPSWPAPDSKMSALALVAASSVYRPVFEPSRALLPMTMLEVPVLGETAPDKAVDDSTDEEEEEPSSPTSTSKRQLPPLLEPLPGGCHGRTSRNNSYCRRQPCYNGSSFCKLHYQQQQQSSRQKPAEQGKAHLQASTCLPVQENQSPSGQQEQHHQDKRFTNGRHETRCLATTTRGRACAYVSVKGTKYCFMHADYDTNPPPRRGGGGNKVPKTVVKSSTATSKAPQSPFRLGGRNTASFKPVPSVQSALSAAEISVSPPPSDASTISPSPAFSKSTSGKQQSLKGLSRRSSARMVEMHSESPYPLLSMLSTDDWFQRRVKIAVGPLAERIGTVQKWGNGWVTVDVPGIGTHNRRSFELYQWPPVGQEEEEEHKVPASVPKHEQEEEGSCQSPPTLGYTSDKLSNEAARSGGSSGAMLVPETPRQDHASSPSLFVETPVPQSSKEDLSVPNVTPTPKKPRQTSSDDVPLVESIMLAQEGGNVNKRCLDLLFGTAALERGRRTVKTVTRYEDTAMIERNKKKGRRTTSSEKTNEEQEAKRSRLET